MLRSSWWTLGMLMPQFKPSAAPRHNLQNTINYKTFLANLPRHGILVSVGHDHCIFYTCQTHPYLYRGYHQWHKKDGKWLQKTGRCKQAPQLFYLFISKATHVNSLQRLLFMFPFCLSCNMAICIVSVIGCNTGNWMSGCIWNCRRFDFSEPGFMYHASSLYFLSLLIWFLSSCLSRCHGMLCSANVVNKEVVDSRWGNMHPTPQVSVIFLYSVSHKRPLWWS